LKTSHATHWHSCVSRQSELCSERFVINNQLLGQTLREQIADAKFELCLMSWWLRARG
jgi:hypothetical protein